MDNLITYAVIAFILYIVWLCIPKDKVGYAVMNEVQDNYEEWQLDMMFGEDR